MYAIILILSNMCHQGLQTAEHLEQTGRVDAVNASEAFLETLRTKSELTCSDHTCLEDQKRLRSLAGAIMGPVRRIFPEQGPESGMETADFKAGRPCEPVHLGCVGTAQLSRLGHGCRGASKDSLLDEIIQPAGWMASEMLEHICSYSVNTVTTVQIGSQPNSSIATVILSPSDSTLACEHRHHCGGSGSMFGHGTQRWRSVILKPVCAFGEPSGDQLLASSGPAGTAPGKPGETLESANTADSSSPDL